MTTKDVEYYLDDKAAAGFGGLTPALAGMARLECRPMHQRVMVGLIPGQAMCRRLPTNASHIDVSLSLLSLSKSIFF